LARLLLLLLAACTTPRGAEDPGDWYDVGDPYAPEEPVAFTDAPYDIPAEGEPGIGELLYPVFPAPFGGALAASEAPDGPPCAGWRVTEDLPLRVIGVVTILPQYYIKSSGCGADEKFYTSYFIEDDTGGVMVLGNSRSAMFDAGDVVELEVRSVQYSFENRLVYGYEVVADLTMNLPLAIHYEVKQAPFDASDIGRVRRVTGTVVQEPDGFGAFYLHPDGQDAPCVPPANNDEDPVGCAIANLSTELNRRPVQIPAGTRLTMTGPVASSFGYKLIITRLGQIERLDETSPAEP
jgi:hypothetical protein